MSILVDNSNNTYSEIILSIVSVSYYSSIYLVNLILILIIIYPILIYINNIIKNSNDKKLYYIMAILIILLLSICGPEILGVIFGKIFNSNSNYCNLDNYNNFINKYCFLNALFSTLIIMIFNIILYLIISIRRRYYNKYSVGII